MRPGSTALTRIPAGASSRAAFLLNISTPALPVEYGLPPTIGMWAFSEATLTIAPPRPCATSWRA